MKGLSSAQKDQNHGVPPPRLADPDIPNSTPSSVFLQSQSPPQHPRSYLHQSPNQPHHPCWDPTSTFDLLRVWIQVRNPDWTQKALCAASRRCGEKATSRLLPRSEIIGTPEQSMFAPRHARLLVAFVDVEAAAGMNRSSYDR